MNFTLLVHFARVVKNCLLLVPLNLLEPISNLCVLYSQALLYFLLAFRITLCYYLIFSGGYYMSFKTNYSINRTCSCGKKLGIDDVVIYCIDSSGLIVGVTGG